MTLFDQSTESGEFTTTLGAVVSLMVRDKVYRHFPMACLEAWVRPALQLKQIKIFYGENGGPAGYMTWAYLAPDVERRWIHDADVMFHISEWNEGEALWIMDFVAPTGYAPMMWRHARDELFADFGEVRWLRRNKDGSVKKVSVWKRPHHRRHA